MGVRLAAPTPRCLIRISWLSHLLLGLSLMAIMLGIVGMHQLSVGHDMATGSQASYHEHAETAGPPHTAAHSHGSDSVMSAAGLDLPASHAVSGGAGLAADDCSACGHHDMALRSCLLALTLLVLSWLLLPPRQRQLPPFLRLRRAPAVIQPAWVRVVPSLSLTELSLRRA